MVSKKEPSFQMKTDYWELKINGADYSRVEILIVFKDKVIPLGELRKLEDSVRKILDACGRIAPLDPSKR